MKRFVDSCLRLLVWTLVWIAGYDYLNLVLVRGASASPAAKVERIFSDKVHEKVAIFGSSRALGNYCPSKIGADVHDYGMNGMGMAETRFLCREYLKRHRPDIVIIDLVPWAFEDLKTSKYIGDYRLAGISSQVRAVLPSGLLGWSDWMPGLRFQGKIRSALAQYINAKKCMTKKVDNGAEILLNSRSDAEWWTLDETLDDFDFNYREEYGHVLDELYALRGRTKIVWIVSPIDPGLRTRFKGMDKLKAFLAEQSKVPEVYARSYLDCASDFPRELFADHRHFNIKGADRLSEMLKEWLMTLR